MQAKMCSRCGKNVAIVFITRVEGNEQKNEGLCLKCARELGLKPEDVDKLLPTLQQNKGEIFGAFKKLSMEDAKKIYLSAF